MNVEDRVSELLVDWDMRRQEGEEVSAAVICRDCPEFVDDLQSQIDELKATDWMCGDDEGDDDFLSLPDFHTESTKQDDAVEMTTSLSLDEFTSCITLAGLMTAEQLSSFQSGLSEPVDATELARQLVKKQRLTAYQANTICEGKTDGLVYGDYVILGRIGAGGMGQVFKARHRRMKRVVALKILPPEAVSSPNAVERFEREVEAAARLLHPNIIVAHDAGEANGVHYLVMECVDGSDLSSLVKENGPVSVAKAVDYIKQATTGLAFAHGKGVVHRDIKPANLLLDGEGTVKILDMGLARLEQPTNGNGAAITQAELTQDGSVLGTVDYMSPEQALDTKNADARADIYSLGCTLYYLLTGGPVFVGNTLMARMLAHRETDIPSLAETRPEVPEELDAVFQKMVAKEPEDRYQTGAELLTDLETIQVADEDDVPQETAVAAETYVDAVSKETSSAQLDETLDLTPRPEESREGEAPAEPCLPVVSARREPRPPGSETVSKKPTASEGHRTNLKTSSNGRGIPTSRIVAIAALLFGGILLAAVLLKILTPHGTVIIEIGDSEEQREVTVTKDGTIKIIDPNDNKEVLVTVDAENKTLTLRKEGFEVQATSFNLKSKDGRYVKVTFVPVEEVGPGGTVDREVASKVLAAGGTVGVAVDGGDPVEAARVEDLPAGDFHIVYVTYKGRYEVTGPFDGLLKELAGLKRLEALYLNYTSVPDVWLEDIGSLTGLRNLGLTATGLTDDDLKCLRNLKQLEGIVLNGNQITDKGLQELQHATRLQRLDLMGTQITGLGFAALSDMRSLTTLYLTGTQTSDAGLEYIAALPLKSLALCGTRVTDRGMAHVKDMELDNLELRDTAITDKGIEIIGGITSLGSLHLERTAVTDEGLQSLAQRKQTWSLHLDGTGITDAGLTYLQPHEFDRLSLNGARITDEGVLNLQAVKSLGRLYLKDTQITDAGLGHFAKIERLHVLDLTGTQVTAEGIAKLKEALPRCNITWDGNAGDEATSTTEMELGDVSAERELASWVLRKQGDVFIAGVKAALQTESDLPDSFAIRAVNFYADRSVTDDDLAEMARLTALSSVKEIGIGGTRITDAGLASLSIATALTKLSVRGTKIRGEGLKWLQTCEDLTVLLLSNNPGLGDSGLDYLKSLRRLHHLDVADTNVSGAGVKAIGQMPQLEALSLRLTKIGDDDVSHLTGLENLRALGLDGTRVTDEGLAHLTQLKSLESLNLVATKVTAEGVAKLKEALPHCNITWDGNAAEDTTVGD